MSVMDLEAEGKREMKLIGFRSDVGMAVDGDECELERDAGCYPTGQAGSRGQSGESLERDRASTYWSTR
jgi:hypothetical protein